MTAFVTLFFVKEFKQWVYYKLPSFEKQKKKTPYKSVSLH
jgi:hypothetical protein